MSSLRIASFTCRKKSRCVASWINSSDTSSGKNLARNLNSIGLSFRTSWAVTFWKTQCGWRLFKADSSWKRTRSETLRTSPSYWALAMLRSPLYLGTEVQNTKPLAVQWSSQPLDMRRMYHEGAAAASAHNKAPSLGCLFVECPLPVHPSQRHTFHAFQTNPLTFYFKQFFSSCVSLPLLQPFVTSVHAVSH